MGDIIVKTYVVCNIEISIDDFYDNYRECKVCGIERILKRNYNTKDKILQQRRNK